jgi:hypothetical protein
MLQRHTRIAKTLLRPLTPDLRDTESEQVCRLLIMLTKAAG